MAYGNCYISIFYRVRFHKYIHMNIHIHMTTLYEYVFVFITNFAHLDNKKFFDGLSKSFDCFVATSTST